MNDHTTDDTTDDATDENVTDQQLARYRSSIDNIDAALVHLLAERFKVTQDVGRYKAAAGLPAADLEREALQVARLRALAEESGLDPVFSEKFLRFIVAEVIHHHQRIAEDADGPADPADPAVAGSA
jgi:chorismate mutase